MLNNWANKGIYSGNIRVFTIFNHISPLNHSYARIKLIYMMAYFNLSLGKREKLLK